MFIPEIITTSNPTPTENYNLLDITIYSRGDNHDVINNEYYSFITINNGYNVIAPTQRGFNVVILDQFNGTIVGKYRSDTFNYSYSIQRDIELANYLKSVKANYIILITVFDTVTADIIEYDRNPNYTLSVLQSFGCNISSIGFRESFIFIGTANSNTNHSLWTYCESNADSNSNGTILSDGAILKSFQIPLSMQQTTDYPSVLSTATDKYPTMDATESVVIENDVHSLFHFKAATDTQIIIGICIILVCCMIPLSIGIAIGCCFYKRKIRINIKQRVETQMTPREHQQKHNKKALDLPEMFSITPPGLAGDDSLRTTPENTERFITSPSGMTSFSAIQFDQRLTVATNITLNIEGFEKEKKIASLNMIDCVLNVSDGAIRNKPLKLGEIMDIESDPALFDDNIEHNYSDDSDHDNDKKQKNTHIEIIKFDGKLNLNGKDSELSDGMYENNDQYIDDKTYTLRTAQNKYSYPAPNSFKLRAPQNEQTSTPNTITAQSEENGEV